MIRSSMSRKDNVHPQQPHNPIIATLILPSRAADSAGSVGVVGISCDADFVGHGASGLVCRCPVPVRGRI